ncbi:MAG: hypothetical protein WD294_00595 [Phycisphaeraceae bacterium]
MLWRECNRRLSARSPGRVYAAWHDAGFEPQLVRKIAGEIHDAVGWENDLFLPHDSCDLLFWSRNTDLGDVEALLRLEDVFAVDVQPMVKSDRPLKDIVQLIAANSS